MKINNLMMVVLGGAIAILMVGTLLIPFVADYTDSTKVYYNNDFGSLASASNETIEYRISYTGNTSGAITEVFINDVKVATGYAGMRAIVISDSYVISQVNSTTEWMIYTGNSVSNSSYTAVTSADITINITKDRSVINYTDSEGAKTLTIDTEWCYYLDDRSDDYRIVNYTSEDKTVYVNDLSQVRGASWINTTGEFFNFEGTSVNVYGNTPESPTMIYEDLADVMNGVISFNVGAVISGSRTDGVHFDVDNNGENYTVYPYFLVIPNSVYGISEDNTTINAMFSMLPIIVLGGIISTVAYCVISRK